MRWTAQDTLSGPEPGQPDPGPRDGEPASLVDRYTSDQGSRPPLDGDASTVSRGSDGAAESRGQDIGLAHGQGTAPVPLVSSATVAEDAGRGRTSVAPSEDRAHTESQPHQNLPEGMATPVELTAEHGNDVRPSKNMSVSNESQLRQREGLATSADSLAEDLSTARPPQGGSPDESTVQTSENGVSESESGSRKSSGRRTPRLSQSMVPPAELSADEIMYLKLLFSRKQRARSAREGMWTPSGLCCECCKRQKAKESLSEAIERNLLRELNRERPPPADVLTVRG